MLLLRAQHRDLATHELITLKRYFLLRRRFVFGLCGVTQAGNLISNFGKKRATTESTEVHSVDYRASLKYPLKYDQCKLKLAFLRIVGPFSILFHHYVSEVKRICRSL